MNIGLRDNLNIEGFFDRYPESGSETDPIQLNSAYQLVGDYFKSWTEWMESQRGIGNAISVSQTAINRWFHGRSRPTPENFGRFAAVRGFSEDEVLFAAGLAGYSTDPEGFEVIIDSYESFLEEMAKEYPAATTNYETTEAI